MRKQIIIFTALFFALTLCACNISDPTHDDTSPNMQISDDAPSSSTEPIHPSSLATEYLEAVQYISNELTDGNYLVYGIDKFGGNCYGILSASGYFEPLTEYAVYYPLADGNFFVTNDEATIRDFNDNTQDTYWKPRCTAGKIIDSNGNTLYEPDINDPYQKMYVVNSETIFVLAVSTGFDGMDVY